MTQARTQPDSLVLREDLGTRSALVQRVVSTAGVVATTAVSDSLVVEEPLEVRLVFGPATDRIEASIAVTMRTPGADNALAVGFLFTEAIVRRHADILAVGPCGSADPVSGLVNVTKVELAHTVVSKAELAQAKQSGQLPLGWQRNFYSTSSCGVCGKASLDALQPALQFATDRNTFRIAIDRVAQLSERLRANQRWFAQTGGAHACGLFDANGEMLSVCEDVGRHNALDKLVGQRLLAGTLPLNECGVMLSGRAGFEMVQKAAMAGCPLVVSVGAPTSLAVDLALEYGMTLIGFATTLTNGFSCNVYSHPERLV